MNNLNNVVNYIYKIGGGNLERSHHADYETKRASVRIFVRMSAFFVSLCAFAILTPSCTTDEDDVPINNPDNNTRSEQVSEVTEADSTNSSVPTIDDWEDGKAGEVVPMTKEEIEKLLNPEQ